MICMVHQVLGAGACGLWRTWQPDSACDERNSGQIGSTNRGPRPWKPLKTAEKWLKWPLYGHFMATVSCRFLWEVASVRWGCAGVEHEKTIAAVACAIADTLWRDFPCCLPVLSTFCACHFPDFLVVTGGGAHRKQISRGDFESQIHFSVRILYVALWEFIVNPNSSNSL